MVIEENKSLYVIGGNNVVYDSNDMSVVCSCKKFVRMGLVCSHMFVVFQNLNIKHIPDKYILSRWSKNAAVVPGENFRSELLNDVAVTETNRISMNHVYSEVHSIAGLDQGNEIRINAFFRILRNFKDELLQDGSDQNGSRNKAQIIQDYYGTSVPDHVSVLPPEKVKTKGSGSRLISRREKAIRVMNKPLRRCNKCKQMARHDARNCDNKIEN